MKKHLFLAVTSLLFSVGSFAQTLTDVLDKHLVAIGGADNLKALTSAKFTQSTIAPGQTFDATATVIFDKATRLDMSIQGTDIQVGTKGETGWVKQGEGAPQDVPAAQLKAITESVTLPGLEVANAYLKKGEMEFKGREKVEGVEYFAIAMPIQGGTSTFYIDPATYLISMRKGNVKAMGQSVDATVEYDDYKKAGALILPHKAKSEAAGQTVTVRLTAYEPNPAIDEAIFDKPKQ